MRIAVIGSGYVGLVTGTCLAGFGHEVTCVDKDLERISGLQSGQVPIFEPGLDTAVGDNVAAGRLMFTSDLISAVHASDVILIAVGTPARRGDGQADLSYVYSAAREIGTAHQSGYRLIVTKSTVPVGTGDEVARIIGGLTTADFDVVSNPEFLREGAAIEDFTHPDRIVVGCDSERSRAVMSDLYRPLTLNHAPIIFTSRRSAELIKYASNAFLAMKIAFINEMADLAEVAGADVEDIARGIGLDTRIGSKFLKSGPGYGGSCFPKDTEALVRTGEAFGSPVRLVETTVALNQVRPTNMVRKIVLATGGNVRGKTIAVLGLTFKPDTDDLRDSPALRIISGLLAEGARVVAYDPQGMREARKLVDGLKFGASAYEVSQDADALVLATEWDEFRSLDFDRLGRSMRSKRMIDLRNVFTRQELERHGFAYTCVGRSIASTSLVGGTSAAASPTLIAAE